MALPTDLIDLAHMSPGRTALTYVGCDRSHPARRFVLQIPANGHQQELEKRHNIYQMCAGTNVPVPRTLLLRRGGVRYLCMERLSGTPFDAKRLPLPLRVDGIRAVAAVIAGLHCSVSVAPRFGWIRSHPADACFRTFHEYMQSESARLAPTVSSAFASTAARFRKDMAELLDAARGRDQHAVLVWYDIQPENILIEWGDRDVSVTGWLDPGAARMGVAEWDIAHAMEHLCSSEAEQAMFVASYESTAGKDLDRPLISSLRRLVLWDDAVLAIGRGWQWLRNLALTRLEQSS